MSVKIIALGRANQIYGVSEVIGINNTGATLKLGDVVLVDALEDGVATSFIAPSSAVLIATRLKGVVVSLGDTSGLSQTSLGAVGQQVAVRIQGPLAANVTASIADKTRLSVGPPVATGGTTLIDQALDLVAGGRSVGVALGAGPATGLSRVLFDGSDINLGTFGDSPYNAVDITGTNNAGATLNVGDAVLLDIVAQGATPSIIAPTTIVLIGSRVKGIVTAGGIVGAAVTIRIKGYVSANATASLAAKTNLTFGAVAATGGTNIIALATDATGAIRTCGSNPAVGPGSGLTPILFDGTDTAYAKLS